MKKISIVLLFLLALSAWAGALDFRVYNKNVSRSLDESKVETLVSEALDLENKGDAYFRVGVNVYAARGGESYVVYLYRKDSYSIDDYQVTINEDGSYAVTQDYVEPTLNDDNEPCGTCPDDEVRVVVSTPIIDPNFYLAERNVKSAAEQLNAAGIKTVSLLGESATAINIIKDWLSCPNLVMWGRIGHGLDRTGEIVVGNNAKIGPDYWKQNPGMLTKKVMLWNSCYVHSEPAKAAVVGTGDAFFYAAGDGVVLQAGPNKSEPVWLEWIEQVVLNGAEMSDAMQAASAKFSYYDYGWTGNPDFSEHYWHMIYGTSITVETPNGGEELIVGTDYDITWSTNSDEAVTVELLKGNSVVETIKSGVSSSKTSVLWSIPEDLEAGENYKIKLVTGDTSDVSDETFTIKKKPTIKVNLEEIEIALDVTDDKTGKVVLTIDNEGEGSLKYGLKCNSGNSVLINEIFTPHNEFFDGFELWNRGNDQDMTGWTVEWKDSDNTSGSYDFKDGYILKSGATCVLTDAQDGTDANTFYVGINLGWSIADTVGTELSITLYDADGKGVDFVKSSGNNDLPPRGCSWSGDGIMLNQQRLYRNSNKDTDSKEDWEGGSGESSVNMINSGQDKTGLGESWMKFSVKEGSVSPAGKKDVEITFNTEGLDLGEYLDTITIVHDDPDTIKEITIPVKMTVDQDVANLVAKATVSEFSIGLVANSLQYQIPTYASGEKVSINLYGLNGRLVKTMVNDTKLSGVYRVSLGKEIATGSYVCKMETKSFQKAMLIVHK